MVTVSGRESGYGERGYFYCAERAAAKNAGTNIQASDGGALTRLSDARGEATIEETLQNAARLHRGLKIFYAPA